MPIKAIFFDLDGTLLDTSRDLGGALNATLIDEGKQALPDHETRAQVSNGANALIKLGFGEMLEPTKHQALRQKLLDFYTSNIATHTAPFEGIEALISQCSQKNIAWGIVTNKPWLYTEKLMRHFQFASEPSCIVCPDHVTKTKPDPEPLRLACKQSQCLPDEALYVGDHLRDIECGINAGITTIAVGYGFTASPEEHLNWGATYHVNHASEIWPIVNSL